MSEQIKQSAHQAPMRAPIFQSIFGADWPGLPPVMQAHYANRPYSSDEVIVMGKMRVELSPLARIMSPLFALTKTLIPKAGDNISVTVHLRSEKDSENYCLDRAFHFPSGKTYRFFSRMEPIGGARVVEWTSSGLGWCCSFHWRDNKVVLSHQGYCLRLFGKIIFLPVTWLLGQGSAWEKPVSDTRFEMKMQIRHALFGELYSYSGWFELMDVKLDD